VASIASGIPDTFQNGPDALLFDVDDVDGLVAQLLNALADPEASQQRAESAKKRVAEYDENHMFIDTVALLRHVATVKNRKRIVNV
jgi:glycosyltransferase involved in cell wall biosynthesis